MAAGSPTSAPPMTAGSRREPRGRGLRERHHRRDRGQRRARRGVRGERPRAPAWRRPCSPGARRSTRTRSCSAPRPSVPPTRAIGDEVRVLVGNESRRFRVVGRAVFPDVGDIGQLGRGAYLTFDAVDGIGGPAPHNVVLVKFAPTADRAAGVASLDARHRADPGHVGGAPARPGQLRARRRTSASRSPRSSASWRAPCSSTRCSPPSGADGATSRSSRRSGSCAATSPAPSPCRP